MKEFKILVTREVTESTELTVSAKSERRAKKLALEAVIETPNLVWETDEAGYRGEPTITSIIQVNL